MSRFIVYLFLCFAILYKDGARAYSYVNDDDEDDENLMINGDKPKILSRSQNFVEQAGKKVILPCEIENKGNFVLVWSKGGKTLFTDNIGVETDDRISLDEGTNALIITSVGVFDSGNYTCKLSTTPPIELTHSLEVMTDPIVTIFPVGRELGPKRTLIVEKGSDFALNCTAIGHPTPSILWLRDGARLEDRNPILRVFNVSEKSDGKYECVGKNKVSHTTDYVNVEIRDRLGLHVKAMWVEENGIIKMRLTCESMPKHDLVMFWQHGNKTTVRQGERFLIQTQVPHTTLTIHPVHPSDFGPYICVAKTKTETTPQTIEASGLANPVEVTFTDATNDEPHILKWKTLSFSALTGFKVAYRKLEEDGSAGEFKEIIVGGEKSGVKLIGLEPHTKYEALVYAQNDYGWNSPTRIEFLVTRAAPSGSSKATAVNFILLFIISSTIAFHFP